MPSSEMARIDGRRLGDGRFVIIELDSPSNHGGAV
jgi:hypothetical protein